MTTTTDTAPSNSLRSMHIDHVCLNVPNYNETLHSSR